MWSRKSRCFRFDVFSEQACSKQEFLNRQSSLRHDFYEAIWEFVLSVSYFAGSWVRIMYLISDAVTLQSLLKAFRSAGAVYRVYA